MTKDEIIEAALEAGFNHPRLEAEIDYYRLERFAEIIEAKASEKERKSMLQLFTDPENQPTQYGTVTVEYMQDEIGDERKACAKVGWMVANSECDDEVLHAILARGNTNEHE